MLCDVVIVGYRLNAKEPAARALERILDLTPEAARNLARSFPAVVIAGAAREPAERLAEQLQAAGALVEVRPMPTAGDAHTRGELRRAETRPEPEASRVSAPNLPAREERTSRAVWRPEPPQPEPSGANTANAPAPASYRLGEFGLDARPSRTEGAAPAAAARAPQEDLALDSLELSSGLPLELEASGPLRLDALREESHGARTPEPSLHTLDDSFDALMPTAALPEVEERAFRSIQRVSNTHEPRRSSTSNAPRSRVSTSDAPRVRGSAAPRAGVSARIRSGLALPLSPWLPSLAMLASLTFGTTLAVGYALDPGDVFGALRRRRFASEQPATPEGDRLHPLLRAAPAAARTPLAAILRARIAGVHELPVHFQSAQGRDAECALVEQGDAASGARLEELRQTGHALEPPPAIAAQLREHARALQTSMRRTELRLVPVCLEL